MKLCRVNVLIYAHREDASPEHEAYASWLTEMATGPSAIGPPFFVASCEILCKCDAPG